MGKSGSFIERGVILSLLALLGIFFGVLLGGCGGGNTPGPSNSYPTSAIYAFMRAVQDESGNVTATLQLRDGTGSNARYLYLGNNDRLYFSINESPQEYTNFSDNLFRRTLDLSQNVHSMAGRDLFLEHIVFTETRRGIPEYISIVMPTAPAVTAYVDFERSESQTSSVYSSVNLPGGFQILSPLGAVTISRATPLALSWNNADATSNMVLEAAGVCDDGNNYAMTKDLGSDTGSATLSSADYFPPPASGVSATANCLTAFIFQRTRTGSVSSQFASGSFTGVQQRVVQFNTTP